MSRLPGQFDPPMLSLVPVYSDYFPESVQTSPVEGRLAVAIADSESS